MFYTTYYVGNNPKRHGVRNVLTTYIDDILSERILYLYDVRIVINIKKKTIEVVKDGAKRIKVPWEDHDDHIQLAKKVYYNMKKM